MEEESYWSRMCFLRLVLNEAIREGLFLIFTFSLFQVSGPQVLILFWASLVLVGSTWGSCKSRGVTLRILKHVYFWALVSVAILEGNSGKKSGLPVVFLQNFLINRVHGPNRFRPNNQAQWRSLVCKSDCNYHNGIMRYFSESLTHK